jgi:hypothetical protein
MPTYLPPNAGVSISQALAEAYATAAAVEPVLFTLELHHPDFTEPVRVVSDWADHTLTLEATAPANAGQPVLFRAVAFRYRMPEQVADLQDGGAPAAVPIEIDGASGEIVRIMLLAKDTEVPVRCIAREYLASDPGGPHILPVLDMTLINIEATVETVRGDLTFGDFTNRRFPATIYLPATHPGLAAS